MKMPVSWQTNRVKGLAAMGQMFRITKLENNTISASLQYANGQGTLNGDKMPLDEFVGMFGMPALDVPDQAAPDAPAEPVAPQQRSEKPLFEGFFIAGW